MNTKIITYLFYILFYFYCYFNILNEFTGNNLVNIKSQLFLILDYILLLLGCFSIRATKDIFIFITFSILSIISQLYNQYHDPIQYFNGVREFIPVLCTLYLLKYLINKRGQFFIEKFNKHLFIFLLLQIPVSIFQYIKHGPGDDVGGTLGIGYSGTISIIIYAITFYLTSYYKIIFTLKNILKILLICSIWLPTFINETKISFILIPLFFIFQINLNKKQIIKSIILITILLPTLFISLKFVYNINERKNTSDYDMEYFENYLLGDNINEQNSTDLPRFLRLKLGYELLCEDKNTLLIGKGLGHFKGGTSVNKTDFSLKYSFLMQGSIIYIFFVLMQLGLLGLILIFIHITEVFKKQVNSYLNLKYKLFYSIILLIAVIYGTTFRGFVFSTTIFFILLSLKDSTKIVFTNKKVIYSNY